MPCGLRVFLRVSTDKMSITRSAEGYLGVSREGGNVFFDSCERVARASFRELLVGRGHPLGT